METKEQILIDLIFPKYKYNLPYSRFQSFFKNNSFSVRERHFRKSKEIYEKVIVSKILNGEDKRTSLIIKNLPTEMTKNDLLEMLSGLGNINYLYLPYDKVNQKNEGFAFINLINYKSVVNIYQKIERLKIEEKNPIELIYSQIQGKDKLSNLFFHNMKRKSL